MNTLQPTFVDDLRKKLEAEKTRALKRIDELSAQDPFNDPDRVNDNAASDTEAGEESNHDRMEALIRELQSTVADIDTALMRIGNGTYGLCAVCGKNIGIERLQIMPAAVLCLECEQKKKHIPQ